LKFFSVQQTATSLFSWQEFESEQERRYCTQESSTSVNRRSRRFAPLRTVASLLFWFAVYRFRFELAAQAALQHRGRRSAQSKPKLGHYPEIGELDTPFKQHL